MPGTGLDLTARSLKNRSNYTTVTNIEGLGQFHANALMVDLNSVLSPELGSAISMVSPVMTLTPLTHKMPLPFLH